MPQKYRPYNRESRRLIVSLGAYLVERGSMAKKIFRLKSLFAKIVLGLTPLLVAALALMGILNYDIAKSLIFSAIGNLHPAVPLKLLVLASILAISSISVVG